MYFPVGNSKVAELLCLYHLKSLTLKEYSGGFVRRHR